MKEIPETIVFDGDRLSRVVRKALGRAHCKITEVRYEPLSGGAASSRIYRFSGDAFDDGKDVSWSLILKIVQASLGDPQASAMRYWKREPLVYSSGLLDDLGPRLAVPRCFAIEEPDPEQSWMWMEDLGTGEESGWHLDTFASVAYDLGHFNGWQVRRNADLSPTWLTRSLLRQWLRGTTEDLEYLRLRGDDPLIRVAFSHTGFDTLIALALNIPDMLDALDRLPQTFCHLDSHRRNLRVEHDASDGHRTIMLDWGLAGLGALGQEISPLITVSCFFFEADLEMIDALDAMVYKRYIEGLHDGGWIGDPMFIRLAYVADATLRFLNRARFVGKLVLASDKHAEWEGIIGRPLSMIVDRFAAMIPYMMSVSNEAIDLCKQVRTGL